MVLLVSSLYCKLVLLFLIYNILTFDQKKKKKELSVVTQPTIKIDLIQVG